MEDMKVSIKYIEEGQQWHYDRVKRSVNTEEFYVHNRMYILSRIPRKFRQRVVFFPEKFTLLDKGKRIDSLIEKFESSKEDYINRVVKQIPESDGLIVECEISLFGTIGSYSIDEGINVIKVFPRFDCRVEDIWATIITAVIHSTSPSHEHNIEGADSHLKWSEKQNDSDIVIKSILPQYKTFAETLNRSTVGDLAIESSQYLLSHGVSIPKYLQELEDKELTNNEGILLGLLKERKDSLVTFEEVGDALWGENSAEVYSLYAITKLVERLRKKIKASGINSELVHTQRGVGYYLYE